MAEKLKGLRADCAFRELGMRGIGAGKCSCVPEKQHY